MAAKAFPLLNLLSEDIGGHQVTKGLLCEPDDPSVPLPLKSRQSSLVALQQIFDQINSNADTECGGISYYTSCTISSCSINTLVSLLLSVPHQVFQT